MDYPIIDCHTHIYPAKIALSAARMIGEFYGVALDGDGSVDSLLRQCRDVGIAKCLALAVSADAAHVQRINDFLISTVNAHPDRLMGFATLHPDMEDPGAEERILYWNPETETLEDFSETGTVNIGALYGTAQDMLDAIVSKHIPEAA